MAVLARRQHGVVSAMQLRAAGLGRGAVSLRVRRGSLHRVHRGVYAVGHDRLPYRGRLWGAVLACGGSGAAAISHRSAAALHDILSASAGPVDVTTLRTAKSTDRIHIHESGMLDAAADVVRDAEGLPHTTVARTLFDLAATLSPHRLERACHRAQILRVLDARAIDALLARSPRHRGASRLRRAVATLAAADPDVTRSELEERFLALVTCAQLPRPKLNAVVAGYEADFVWPQQRLIAETDGVAAHLTPTAFAHDRRRDIDLQIAGYRVARFTWPEVTGEPEAVASRLRTLLASTSQG